jgi:hypothetical protein
MVRASAQSAESDWAIEDSDQKKYAGGTEDCWPTAGTTKRSSRISELVVLAIVSLLPANIVEAATEVVEAAAAEVVEPTATEVIEAAAKTRIIEAATEARIIESTADASIEEVPGHPATHAELGDLFGQGVVLGQIVVGDLRGKVVDDLVIG